MPECANYYGDLEFGNEELVKAGNFFKYFLLYFFHSSQCARTDLNKRFLPKPILPQGERVPPKESKS